METYTTPTYKSFVDKQTRQTTRKNASTLNVNERRIDALERKLDKLSLLTEGLWQILKQESTKDDAFLTEQINQLVLKKETDAKTKVKCPSCALDNLKTKSKCIYCGDALEIEAEPSLF